MLEWILIPAVAVIAILTFQLWKRLNADRIQQFNDRRRGSSRLVGRGELIDGSRHIPVAMALGDSALYYENSEMQASLDLEWIQEVEYENELATGQTVRGGRVLRLRCASRVFEFILPENAVPRWKLHLPALHLAGVAAAS